MGWPLCCLVMLGFGEIADAAFFDMCVALAMKLLHNISLRATMGHETVA